MRTSACRSARSTLSPTPLCPPAQTLQPYLTKHWDSSGGGGGGVSAVLPQGQEGPEKVLEIQQHPKALVTSCALTSPALDVQPLYRVSGSV